MISVFPLQKDKTVFMKFPVEIRRQLNESITSKMPSVYVATNHDEYVAVGFKYRRTSVLSEITWWHGSNLQLLEFAIQALLAASLLEGRRRVECFNESQSPVSVRPRSKTFTRALEGVGFVCEGLLPLWTPALEDVELYRYLLTSHSTNEWFHGVDVVVLAQNERTEYYFEKNCELLDHQDLNGLVALRETLYNRNTIEIQGSWKVEKDVMRGRELFGD